MERNRALEEALHILRNRYMDTLVINEGEYDGQSFLHVSSKAFTQGLSFVSAFYVIVTCELSEDGLDVFQFSLVSYHGKKLTDLSVPMDPDSLEDSKLPLLDDMAFNNIHICQGVHDLKEKSFKQYLQRSRLPILDKVKSTFFIEPLEEDVVLRSRSCSYIVVNPVRNEDPNATDYVRCDSCAIYQRQRRMTLFTHRRLKLESLSDLNEDKEEPVKPSDYDKNVFVHSSAKFQEPEEGKRREIQDFAKDLEPAPKLVPFKDFKPEVLHEEIDDNSGALKKAQRRSKCAAQDLISDIKQDPAMPDSEEFDFETESNGSSENNSGHKRFKPDVSDGSKADKSGRKKRKKGIKHESDEDGDFDPMDLDDDDEDLNVSIEKKSKGPYFQEAIEYVEVYIKTKDGVEKLEMNSKTKGYRLKSKSTYLFQCTVCLRAATHRFSIVNCIKHHKDAFDLSEKVPCPDCQLPIQRGQLSPHYEEVHPGHLSCFCCFKIIEQEPKITLNFDDDQRANNQLRGHIIKEHHAATSRSHFCGECGMVLHSAKALEDHVRSKHKPEEESPYLCHLCSSSFNSDVRLTAHIRKRHNDKSYKCLHCDKTFQHDVSEYWFRHLAIHTNLKPYSCAQCNYCTEKKSNVTIHLKKQHGKDKVDSSSDIVTDEAMAREMTKMCRADFKLILAGKTKR